MKRFPTIFTAVRLATRVGACVLICCLSVLVMLSVGRLLSPESPVSAPVDTASPNTSLDLRTFTSEVGTGYWTFAGWDWELSPPVDLGSGSAGEEPPISKSTLSFDASDNDNQLIQSLVALNAEYAQIDSRSRYKLVRSDFQLFVDTAMSGGRPGIGEAFLRYQDSSDSTWREIAIRRKRPAGRNQASISLPLPAETTLVCSRISNGGSVTAALATSLSVSRSLVETWRGLGYTVEEQPDGLVCRRSDEVFFLWCPPNLRDQAICLIQVLDGGDEMPK